jgi:hypothetical protein
MTFSHMIWSLLIRLWNFGIGYATPYLVNVGPGSAGLQSKVFFIWGSTCACCWVFTYFCVPEVCRCILIKVNLTKYLYRPRVFHWSKSTLCTNAPRPSVPCNTADSSSPTTSTLQTLLLFPRSGTSKQTTAPLGMGLPLRTKCRKATFRFTSISFKNSF